MIKQLLLTSALLGGSFLAHAQTAAVEITGSASPARLRALCQKYRVPGIYRWQNHLVAYGPTARIKAVHQHLAALYPGTTVKLYAAPFYQFDRHYCADKAVSGAWDNILLTANLVPDPARQQEYLRYHATQFQKWPEVAQGFCHASFQQLLVFRQGRQLLLVISIPHGKSLDELNPKTTENNPRVTAWNTLMKQYQQGLPGTKEGETWVFLQPVAAVGKAAVVK